MKKYYRIIRYIACYVVLILIGIGLIAYGMYLCKVTETSAKGAVIVSVGASIFATVVVDFIGLFKKIIKSEIIDKYNNVIIKAGIDNAWPNRNNDIYRELVRKSSKRILVSGYSLNAFYESHNEELLNKIRNDDFVVRILMVSPHCDASVKQESLEGKGKGVFLSSVNRIVKAFAGKNIEIKFIDHALSTMIFCIDDDLFIGPHFSKSSMSTVTIQLNRSGWMFTKYLNEFESLWEKASNAAEPAVVGAVQDEVIGPDVALPTEPQPDAGAVGKS